jgi:5'-nucleotidase
MPYCFFPLIRYFCDLNNHFVENERLILISNDDGVNAKGLRALIEVARPYGRVVVAAPAEAMSGMSHAITIKNPLRARKVEEQKGLTVYSCYGTPVDCVKLALNQMLDRKPDLILSGINHGSNSSSSVVYSGTMAVAMEGCINLIPSAGFSLLDYDHDADFEASKKIASKIVDNIVEQGLPEGICLNVNIPATGYSALKGIKICRQTRGYWKEEFVKRVDPHNAEYYWLTGYYFNQEEEAEDTDEFALKSGYVSVVPIQVDLTAYQAFNHFKNWNLNSL